MVDFEWYRSFIAVYRAGTVTGAAEARALTQPAISQHISALETAVGGKLFKRTPRKMVPTAQGKQLYTVTSPAMDNLERVSVNLRKPSVDDLPLIRLGVPLDYFYEAGLKKVGDANLKLQIEFGDTDQMIKKLRKGSLDGVIATQQLDHADVDYFKIDQEAFCLVSEPNMQLPDGISDTKDELERFLAKQNWISYSEELPILRRFWHIAFDRRPSIEPTLIAPSLLLIRKAVEQGLGISVLPRYICERALDEGRLKVLWEPKTAVLNELWIAMRKVDRNRPEIEQIVTCLQA